MTKVPTVQETQDYHGWRTMCHPSNMPKATEIDAAKPKSVTDHYSYDTDKIMADTGALPCNSDENAWQGLINETAWATDQRHWYEPGTTPPREGNVKTIVEGLAEMDKALRRFRKLHQEAIETSVLAFNLLENGGAKHETVHNAVPECSRAIRRV